MGYHLVGRQHARARRRNTGMAGLGGISDIVLDVISGVTGTNVGAAVEALSASTNDATQNACIAQAKQTGAIAKIDLAINDISKNWQPSGFYTPDQILQIVNLVTVTTLVPALTLVGGAPLSTSDAADQIAGYQKQLRMYMGTDPDYTGATAQTFIAGAGAATAQGKTVVEAQGLKAWVMKAMLSSSAAMTLTSVLNCNTTFLDSIWNGIVAIGNFVKALGSLVVGAAEAVFTIPDTLSTMWKVVKYGAIAGAAYLIWHEFLKGKLGK